MRETTLEEIQEFLCEILYDGCALDRDKIKPDSDLLFDLGVDGDDWDEVLPAFAKRFQVDLGGFLWYFHHGEEGLNPLSFVFPPPNLRVKHIPVTPRTLLESARSGKWAVTYPKHKLPKRRPDVVALWACLGAAAVLGTSLWIAQKLAR